MPEEAAMASLMCCVLVSRVQSGGGGGGSLWWQLGVATSRRLAASLRGDGLESRRLGVVWLQRATPELRRLLSCGIVF